MDPEEVAAGEASSWASWLPFWKNATSKMTPGVEQTGPIVETFDELTVCENKILSKLKTPYRQYMVPITIDGETHMINTFETTQEDSSTLHKQPLVLVHGFAGGLGIFVKNFDALAKYYKVYAFDGLGWGKSSRPAFPTDAERAEALFVHSIEKWREALNIEKMVLLGHSFGGYQVATYALVHPERIDHLVLADPWGFPSKPANVQESRPLWVRGMLSVLGQFNPLAVLRAAGKYAPSMLARIRPDFQRKFGDMLEGNLIYEYIYYLNARKPSAEIGFRNLMQTLGWAQRPMIERIANVDKNVPITFIYGGHTWMDPSMGIKAQALRPGCHVHVEIVPGAGHHVYVDRFDRFNALVNSIALAAAVQKHDAQCS